MATQKTVVAVDVACQRRTAVAGDSIEDSMSLIIILLLRLQQPEVVVVVVVSHNSTVQVLRKSVLGGHWTTFVSGLWAIVMDPS